MLWSLLLVTAATTAVDARFIQVAPAVHVAEQMTRSLGQGRAVVLIPGFTAKPSLRTQPTFHAYEAPDSHLVQHLAAHADVFAFAYSQTVPVDDIAGTPVLHAGVERLRELGYQDIVLVGFSAGGLVARQFVEDTPTAGVTKVVQVCAANGGSIWSVASFSPFAQSLSPKTRSKRLEERRAKKIPADVQFACVVATVFHRGDGVVSVHSQWPDDLQEQGIPAYTIRCDHITAARGAEGSALIARLVQEEQPRWDAARVAAGKKELRSWK